MEQKDGLHPHASVNEKQCDSCGLTLSELSRSGLMGCERCYEIFSLEVELALEAVQNRSALPTRLPWPTRTGIDLPRTRQPGGPR
jgi:protein-arginine kinase activator protein McsA